MRTAALFPKLSEICEIGLNAMPIIENALVESQKKTGVTFSPSQAFLLAYFRRNKMYLQSAYLVGAMGFYGPSMNLQRTVYETVLRGYLFIVDPDEANSYHDNLKPGKVEIFLKSRNYYGHKFLCEKLFDETRKKQQRKFYALLCESAHAEIKGLLLDYPKYNRKNVEDSLKILLMLSYGNLQMVSEMFLESFDDNLKKFTADFLKEIATSVGNQIPLFEPNKGEYESKIRLKRGNFLEILK